MSLAKMNLQKPKDGFFQPTNQKQDFSHLYGKESTYQDHKKFVFKVLGKEKNVLDDYEEGNEILYASIFLEAFVRLKQVKDLGRRATVESTGIGMYELTTYKRLSKLYDKETIENHLTNWQRFGMIHMRIGNIYMRVLIQMLLL